MPLGLGARGHARQSVRAGRRFARAPASQPNFLQKPSRFSAFPHRIPAFSHTGTSPRDFAVNMGAELSPDSNVWIEALGRGQRRKVRVAGGLRCGNVRKSTRLFANKIGRLASARANRSLSESAQTAGRAEGFPGPPRHCPAVNFLSHCTPVTLSAHRVACPFRAHG